jgi:prolyl-tRNA synthetase
MRLSHFFVPTLKETPSDAYVISHKLMLRAGMVQQTASGLYAWLPFGLKVLRKIEAIITQEQEKAGACGFILPMIQSADLWRESGRYDAYGLEMLRLKDRHDRDLLFGPTAEEVITHVFRSHIHSYKQLPHNWFQIHWKFRDEIRPRFGVMRGREFLMKDGYSFDITEDAAKATYKRVYNTYIQTFQRMGLKVLPVQANPGAIGGNLSHEFHVLAQVGESTLYYDKTFDALDTLDFDAAAHLYAAEEEMHEANSQKPDASLLKTTKGIEVGHIFYYGDKYTRSMNAGVKGPSGETIYPFGGCYGIGVSRLVAAIIEASHDEKGIIWPKEVAPFDAVLINMCPKNDEVVEACDALYEKLQRLGFSMFYDDTFERAGVKFSNADLMGHPFQLIIGKKYLDEGILEVKNRQTSTTQHLSFDGVVECLNA